MRLDSIQLKLTLCLCVRYGEDYACTVHNSSVKRLTLYFNISQRAVNCLTYSAINNLETNDFLGSSSNFTNRANNTYFFNIAQKTCLIFQAEEYTLTNTWKTEVSNANQLPS